MRIQFDDLRNAGLVVNSDSHGVTISCFEENGGPHPIVNAIQPVLDNAKAQYKLNELELDRIAGAMFDAWDREIVSMALKKALF